MKTKKSAHDKMRFWPLQDAKARFSELFRRVHSDGPQRVKRQGKETVVVVTEAEFERLRCRHSRRLTLAEFFGRSPLAGANLDLGRSPDQGRPVDL